jgi:hypothetical protein
VIMNRPATVTERPYARSSARQPMSVRKNPPGQSICLTTA